MKNKYWLIFFVIIFSIYGISKLKVENSFINYFSKDTEIYRGMKLIDEKLEIDQQICLVNFIQIIWWRNTKKIDLIEKLENLKFYLRKKIQPRLAWEITFLQISMMNVRN